MLVLATLLVLAQTAAQPAAKPPTAAPRPADEPRLISYKSTPIGLRSFGAGDAFKPDYNQVLAYGPGGSILGVARCTESHRDVPAVNDKITAQAGWIFRDGKTTALVTGGAQPGADAWNLPVAINAKGLVIGNTKGLAWVWENGRVTWLDLPGPQFQTAAGERRSTVVGLSDSGIVAGQSPFREDTVGSIAWRWVEGHIEPLGLTAPPYAGDVLERCSSRTLAVTRSGLIVGSSGRLGDKANRFGVKSPTDFAAWTFDGRDYKTLEPGGAPIAAAPQGLTSLVCSPAGRLAFTDSGRAVLVKDGGFEAITVPGARPGSVRPLFIRDDGAVAGEAQIPLDARRSLTALWVHKDGKTTRVGLTEAGATSNVFIDLQTSPLIRGVASVGPDLRSVPWVFWEGKTVKALLNDADHKGSSGGHGDVAGVSERGLVVGLSNRTVAKAKVGRGEGIVNDPWCLDLRTGTYSLLARKPEAANQVWTSEPLGVSPDGIVLLHHTVQSEKAGALHLFDAWTAAEGFRTVELLDADGAKPLEIGIYGVQVLRVEEGARRLVALLSYKAGTQFTRRELHVLERLGAP